jgi:hypothetical protein
MRAGRSVAAVLGAGKGQNRIPAFAAGSVYERVVGDSQDDVDGEYPADLVSGWICVECLPGVEGIGYAGRVKVYKRKV